jgi:uncharacterized protein (DUF305 family)
MNKRELLSALGGLIIGVFAALGIFTYMVPSGVDMIGLYYPERLQSTKKDGSFSTEHSGHASSTNPYMMGNVTSEQQFLKDMVLHHEAAIAMARQVIALNPSERVKLLAEMIIRAQTDEVEVMSSWVK